MSAVGFYPGILWTESRRGVIYYGQDRNMKKLGFQEALNQLLVEDPRYEAQAYHFIREALDFTIKHFSKPVEGPGRHVSGTELLEGIRKFALQEYGPLTKTVLNRWGFASSDDFGHVVFNLVEKGILGKTQEDRLEDFAHGFDFEDAFRKPFLPKQQGEVVPRNN